HCGISFPTFRNWIARNRLPDAIETYRIAQALNTSVEYLVTGENPGKPDLSDAINQIESGLNQLKKL
ncbi:MAG: helix-turn-helix domain containing protein, partial [Treponema sp.]|nr:helix-turn-helix domain containing protein [Treponema sp.]